jgi:microsomal epoxide hydrolase
MPQPKSLLDPVLDDFDTAGIERGRKFTLTGGGYALEHATRPSTVGLAIGCNPLSILTWFKPLLLNNAEPALTLL